MFKFLKNLSLKSFSWIIPSGAILSVFISFALEHYFKDNIPPKASILYQEIPGAPHFFRFDGGNSSDSEGRDVSYKWFINGKQVSEDESFEYQFHTPGSHQVKLEVKDIEELIDHRSVLIPIPNPDSLKEALNFINYKISFDDIKYKDLHILKHHHHWIIESDDIIMNLTIDNNTKLSGTWNRGDKSGKVSLKFEECYSEAYGNLEESGKLSKFYMKSVAKH